MPKLRTRLSAIHADGGYAQLRTAKFWTDAVERVASTFVQTLAVALLAHGTTGIFTNPEWTIGAEIAGVAAGVTLVTSAALACLKPDAGDLLRRTLLTFAQAFVGAFATTHFWQSHLHATTRGLLAYAFTVAMTAAVKSLAKKSSTQPAPAAAAS